MRFRYLIFQGINVTFEKLALHPAILQAIVESGYTTPTPIQAQAIPQALAGHDLMASAQTGTGKTAAFVLPSLQRLSTPSAVSSRGPRVLVLTPTRELANQVTDAAAKYGRLLDHMERGRVDYSRLEVLVLDEADRMLDMGFIHAVEKIAAATPKGRQTLLFSATLEGNVAKLASRLLKNPKRIQIATAQERHEQIEQRLHHVDGGDHKRELLARLLSDSAMDKAIVFTATKRGADRLAKALHAQGHPATALHGDMNQNQRNRAITNLRSGSVRLLVATDVAARGLDVSGITHVINYDMPKSPEDYVHRIGRTGRAGAKGVAISFASPEDRGQLRDIERYTRQGIPVHVVAGLEPTIAPGHRQPQNRPRQEAHRHNGTGKKPAHRGSGHAGAGHPRRNETAQRPQAQRHDRKDFRRSGSG